MRIRLAVCLVELLVCAGCAPWCHVVRTSVIEPLQYPSRLNDCCDEKFYKKLAEAAWKKFVHDNPHGTYSADYATGFTEGYADYLYAGGSGTPPLPPRCYWTGRHTAEGHRAMQDWSAGFRHGAASAKESGYREHLTLPSTMTHGPADPPHETSISPNFAPLTPAVEELLRPREVPAKSGS